MYSSLLQKLPIVIAGILLLIAALAVYFRAKNVTRGEFWKIFKTAKYLEVSALIFVFVLTVFFGIFNHRQGNAVLRAAAGVHALHLDQDGGRRIGMRQAKQRRMADLP